MMPATMVPVASRSSEQRATWCGLHASSTQRAVWGPSVCNEHSLLLETTSEVPFCLPHLVGQAALPLPRKGRAAAGRLTARLCMSGKRDLAALQWRLTPPPAAGRGTSMQLPCSPACSASQLSLLCATIELLSCCWRANLHIGSRRSAVDADASPGSRERYVHAATMQPCMR